VVNLNIDSIFRKNVLENHDLIFLFEIEKRILLHFVYFALIEILFKAKLVFQLFDSILGHLPFFAHFFHTLGEIDELYKLFNFLSCCFNYFKFSLENRNLRGNKDSVFRIFWTLLMSS
jgi:hypothetical protein